VQNTTKYNTIQQEHKAKVEYWTAVTLQLQTSLL
jgi:hypothetical protein